MSRLRTWSQLSQQQQQFFFTLFTCFWLNCIVCLNMKSRKSSLSMRLSKCRTFSIFYNFHQEPTLKDSTKPSTIDSWKSAYIQAIVNELNVWFVPLWRMNIYLQNKAFIFETRWKVCVKLPIKNCEINVSTEIWTPFENYTNNSS